MFAVLKREFRSYFQNVIGWLFVAALMALFGLYFYVYNLRQGYPYLYYTLSAITIIFMIAVPILTMRSFAEDRKNKTDQLMLTAPVPVAKVVLGKYLAMLAVFSRGYCSFLCDTAHFTGVWNHSHGRELYCHTGVLVIWSSFHCGRYVYFRIDGKPGDCGSSDVCGTVYQLYDAESDRTYFIGWELADKDFKLSGSVCTV